MYVARYTFADRRRLIARENEYLFDLRRFLCRFITNEESQLCLARGLSPPSRQKVSDAIFIRVHIYDCERGRGKRKSDMMSRTREQAGPSKPSGSAGSTEEKEKDDRMFECNICLDTAKDAVVSMCGHLFCWPCLHQWLETRPTRQVCPVCKAAISKDKVIPLYGRGATKHEDPRNNVPPRPAGQRSEPEANVGFPGFGFGDGSYMSFGIGTFPFAFFTSTFNFGETRPSPAPRGTPQYEEEQFLSKIFLWLAVIFICWLLMA